MKLQNIVSNLKNYDCEKRLLEQDVGEIVFKVDEVKKGDVFVCLAKTGEDEIYKEAIKNGASVVVGEKVCGDRSLVVKDSREAFALLSKGLSFNACDKLKIIAVTGTNGKTTTVKIIADLLKMTGKKVGVVGTLGAGEVGNIQDTGFTTPDPNILHKKFADFVDKGLEYVVMEASAHSIELQKLKGIKFDAAIFTNLTQDHLDFFGDMEKYFQAKKKLFSREYSRMAIVNLDDPYGKRLLTEREIPSFSYSSHSRADVDIEKLSLSLQGTSFFCHLLGEGVKIESKLVGEYNVQNLLGALTALNLFGVSKEKLKKYVKYVSPAEGRFNQFEFNGANVVVDFAHTPDGLKNVLSVAKEMTKGRLLCVFGCGGNRDKGKRPIMGRITEELCDHVIVTSDNPRFEKAEDIAKEIEVGMQKDNHEIVIDRGKAICRAMLSCQPGDTLVIAGKGGEKYQDIDGIKRPYDDFEVVSMVKERSEMAK